MIRTYNIRNFSKGILKTYEDGYHCYSFLRNKDVIVTKAELVTYGEFHIIPDYGELRVYFDISSWDLKSNGLIYTDKGFLEDLKRHFISFGFTPKAVSRITYSEQGMQGDDYVSLDVDSTFITHCFLDLSKT